MKIALLIVASLALPAACILLARRRQKPPKNLLERIGETVTDAICDKDHARLWTDTVRGVTTDLLSYEKTGVRLTVERARKGDAVLEYALFYRRVLPDGVEEYSETNITKQDPSWHLDDLFRKPPAEARP